MDFPQSPPSTRLRNGTLAHDRTDSSRTIATPELAQCVRANDPDAGEYTHTNSPTSPGSGPGSPLRIESHDARLQAFQSPHEIAQEPQRSRIGPVNVVDEQQEWALCCEVGDQPVKPVQNGEGLAGRIRVGASLTEYGRACKRREASEQATAARGRRGAGSVHLPAVGGRLRKGNQIAARAPRAVKHARTGANSTLACLGKQRGLADPGWAFEHQTRTRARNRSCDGVIDLGKLSNPLHQPAPFVPRHVKRVRQLQKGGKITTA